MSFTNENNKPFILLIGDAGVGKSSYIRKLANQGFSETYIPTIGYEDTFIPGIYNFIELSGQEPHNAYAEQVLRRTDRIYLMVATNSKTSIENIPFWINKYKYLHKNFFLLVNKSDVEPGFDLAREIESAKEHFTNYLPVHHMSCKEGPLFV